MTTTLKETVYHVFTHQLDEWLESYQQAYELYKQWAQDYDSARLYIQIYDGTELDSEDCLEATGEFPL